MTAFTITVTDASNATDSQALTITITGAQLVITTPAALPGGTVGLPYAEALQASGGQPPDTWSVLSGALPAGLALAADGTLTGVPTAAGSSTATVQVMDSLGGTATKVMTMIVAVPALVVTTGELPSGFTGVGYTGNLGAAGGTPPYAWAVQSGALPGGLALNTNGTIGGVPDAAGQFPFTAQVTDATTAVASAALMITIAPLPVVVSPGPWKFLYGPPQPAGGYTAVLGQAQNRRLILRSEPATNHEASFDIDGRNRQAAALTELQTDVQVLYGTDIVFCGRVVPTTNTLDSAAGTHRRAVTALDYREVLRRRIILPGDQVTWTGVEQALIAWQLIQHAQSHPGSGLGISPGAGQVTGTNRAMTFAVADFVGTDIDTMAQLANGFEWQITPYGTSDLRLDVFTPVMGSDKGRVLIWGSHQIASITRSVDPSTFANAVYVTGDSTVSLTAQQLDASDITTRPEGRWDAVVGTTLKTQSSLDDDAAQELANAEVLTPSYTVTLVRGGWAGPDDIWLGDTVRLVIQDGSLNVDDKLRVVEMDFAIDADGVETLTMSIGAIPLRLPKKIAAMLKNLRFLNTR